MGEFHELVKKFEKIRDYMRDFYVYGFKSREELANKSLRTYDDEKRRIESYLGEYMSFRQNEAGKQIFLSVDSTMISANPLYRAFKAKSFTKNDITLHFILLDILQEEKAYTVKELMDCIDSIYLTVFQEPILLDIATLRNKLKEYTALGIFTMHNKGKTYTYALSRQDIQWEKWKYAVLYFSEISPLGVAGSYLMDQHRFENQCFCYKHHYIMYAIESEIIEMILDAIRQDRRILLENYGRQGKVFEAEVIPLRFLISVQGGRQYLSVYHTETKSIQNYRLDGIKTVKLSRKEANIAFYRSKLDAMLPYTWGASLGDHKDLEHLEMAVYVEEYEQYIVERLTNEGRKGIVEQVDKTTYQYQIDVYDAMEMLPWIRTFTGRILSLTCSNEAVIHRFYKDFEEMRQIYG